MRQALWWLSVGKRENISVKTAEPSNVTLTGAAPLVITGAPSRTAANRPVCAALHIHSREDKIKVPQLRQMQRCCNGACHQSVFAEHVIKIETSWHFCYGLTIVFDRWKIVAVQFPVGSFKMTFFSRQSAIFLLVVKPASCLFSQIY